MSQAYVSIGLPRATYDRFLKDIHAAWWLGHESRLGGEYGSQMLEHITSNLVSPQ